MEKVIKGSAFKDLFLNSPELKRVLKPHGNSFKFFHSLDDIEDNFFYLMKEKEYGEIVLEKVEMIF